MNPPHTVRALTCRAFPSSPSVGLRCLRSVVRVVLPSPRQARRALGLAGFLCLLRPALCLASACRRPSYSVAPVPKYCEGRVSPHPIKAYFQFSRYYDVYIVNPTVCNVKKKMQIRENIFSTVGKTLQFQGFSAILQTGIFHHIEEESEKGEILCGYLSAIRCGSWHGGGVSRWETLRRPSARVGKTYGGGFGGSL